MFVLLQLKTYRKTIGDNCLGKLLSRERRLTRRYWLEFVMLLISHQRVHPRKKRFTAAIDFLQLLAGPLIIFVRADDKFHLVARSKVFEVAIQVSLTFAATWALEVDDAMYT